MTRTEEIPTRYGTTEVEVVECVSCGNDFPKEDTAAVAIGDDFEDVTTWHSRGTYEVEFTNHNVETGRVCEFCREDPTTLPNRARRWLARRSNPELFVIVSLMAFFFGFLIGFGMGVPA